LWLDLWLKSVHLALTSGDLTSNMQLSTMELCCKEVFLFQIKVLFLSLFFDTQKQFSLEIVTLRTKMEDAPLHRPSQSSFTSSPMKR
jgi:hypothetical protein